MTLLEEPAVDPVVTRTVAGHAAVRDVQDGSTELEVCSFDDLVPDRGVCALVGGAPVAVFRCSPDDELFAVGNIDPYSAASVLSRGIVGSVGDRPVIASPIYKNRFDLRTGQSLDDPAVRLPVHEARVDGGRVLVGPSPVPPASG
jgi:nitrite reductase (NADH) small subunit